MDQDALNLAVRRAQTGDAEAFGVLYKAQAGRIYALCLRLEGDPVRAEELVQDVFVRAWRQLASFRFQSAFGTWLHRLAVNVVLGDRRAAWRRERRVMLSEAPEVLETAPAMPDPGAAMDLEAAVAGLPPGARAVFVLHDIEGYQHGEIASMTGIAEGTSKAQLFRARRLLRKALDR